MRKENENEITKKLYDVINDEQWRYKHAMTDALYERIEHRSTVMYSEEGHNIRLNMTDKKYERANNLRRAMMHKNNEAFAIVELLTKVCKEYREEYQEK